MCRLAFCQSCVPLEIKRRCSAKLSGEECLIIQSSCLQVLDLQHSWQFQDLVSLIAVGSSYRGVKSTRHVIGACINGLAGGNHFRAT